MEPGPELPVWRRLKKARLGITQTDQQRQNAHDAGNVKAITEGRVTNLSAARTLQIDCSSSRCRNAEHHGAFGWGGHPPGGAPPQKAVLFVCGSWEPTTALKEPLSCSGGDLRDAVGRVKELTCERMHGLGLALHDCTGLCQRTEALLEVNTRWERLAPHVTKFPSMQGIGITPLPISRRRCVKRFGTAREPVKSLASSPTAVECLDEHRAAPKPRCVCTYHIGRSTSHILEKGNDFSKWRKSGCPRGDSMSCFRSRGWWARSSRRPWR